MKNLSKIILIVLITFSYTNSYSQDNNNPWQFSFGVHAVDLEVNSQSEFGDFFAVDKNWNVSSGLSMFTLSKYLGDNLSIGLSGSVNSISNFAQNNVFVNEVSYFAADLMVKYSLAEVLNFEVIEPYVGIGVGNTCMDTESWLTTNGTIGMNYWFSDVLGLTAQADYKMNMSENGSGNTILLDDGGSMRYSLGFSLKFGGEDKE